MKIKKLISGGQTGADRGGLLAARDLGIPTGGTAPKNFKTEAGYAPWLKGFGLIESKSSQYSPRTERNVADADVTIVFGVASAGSLLTMRICSQLSKPYLWLYSLSIETETTQLMEFLNSHATIPLTLNIAGNRESVSPGIQEHVRRVLNQVLARYI